MNKIVILFLIGIFVFISGCAPKPLDRREVFIEYNFTKYTSFGFLITPEKYDGKYESIGMLTYIITPSIRYSSLPHGRLEPNEIAWGNIIYEHINVEDAIDKMYEKALDMGANAIMRFNIDDSYPFLWEDYKVPLGVKITGYAIKRIE